MTELKKRKGKGKGKGQQPAPAPQGAKGKGKGQPTLGAVMGELLAAKGTGKGKGQQPVPEPEPEDAKGKGKGENPLGTVMDELLAAKGKGKSTPPITLEMVNCSAWTLNGREVRVSVATVHPVLDVMAQVGRALGINPYRVRLVLGHDTLDHRSSVGWAGIVEGSQLTIVVLPPVYGVFRSNGLDVPDEAITGRLELHESLLQKKPKSL